MARTFSSLVLGGWGLVPLADDALLVVSELAANVTQAATGPDGRPRYGPSGRLPVLWLRLLSDGARLRVEVWDTLPAGLGGPAPRDATTDDESGRGLQLVAGLSQGWGWEHLPGHAAKRVWALLAPAKKGFPS